MSCPGSRLPFGIEEGLNVGNAFDEDDPPSRIEDLGPGALHATGQDLPGQGGELRRAVFSVALGDLGGCRCKGTVDLGCEISPEPGDHKSADAGQDDRQDNDIPGREAQADRSVHVASMM